MLVAKTLKKLSNNHGKSVGTLYF